VPDFLSEAWFEVLAEALGRLDADVTAMGGVAIALGQIVTEVPAQAAVGAQGGEVSYTVVLRSDGSASLVRGSTAEADVVLVEDFATAQAVATGSSSVSDMLSAGRIKLRGDTRALVAAGDLLTTIAPLVLQALGGAG
jgi:hypothetical protein